MEKPYTRSQLTGISESQDTRFTVTNNPKIFQSRLILQRVYLAQILFNYSYDVLNWDHQTICTVNL